MTKLISTNPAEGYKVVGEVNISTDDEIKQKVNLANKAKKNWKQKSVKQRLDLLKPIINEFFDKREEIAELISKEMGKPITQSFAEIDSYKSEFNWLLNNAEKALADEITVENENFVNFIRYEPFGVSAVITPWNFPFKMALWGIVPNLTVGNTVVFKISEETPLMGKFIEDVFSNHNLPEGVFGVVHGAGDVGQKLSESDINHIWFTGSSKVGKQLYRTAAKKFIPVLLEMGGSNPFIVFEDADLDAAVNLVYDGRFRNCGQVCTSIKRAFIHDSIYNKFKDKLITIIKSKKQGIALDKETDICSLSAERQLKSFEVQFEDAISKGARILTGGKRPSDLSGAYFKPTVLENISKDMKVYNEEVFGPLLPLIKFSSDKEALELANDTEYGLGSRIMTSDKDRIEFFTSNLEAGAVEVSNAQRFHPANPFGGYKSSGMGREGGIAGLRNLVQLKLIAKPK